MRCPNCRSKMEKGNLESGKDIVWSSKALLNKPEDVLIVEKKLFGGGKEAFYCMKCGYLVMDTREK